MCIYVATKFMYYNQYGNNKTVYDNWLVNELYHVLKVKKLKFDYKHVFYNT